MERDALLEVLITLTEPTFQMVIARSGVRMAYLPSEIAPLATRAIALFHLLEQSGGGGTKALEQILDQVLAVGWRDGQNGGGPPLKQTEERTSFVPQARSVLESRLSELLKRDRRLLLLAPRRGGARDLTERLAKGEEFGGVTKLLPSLDRTLSRQAFFQDLTQDTSITTGLEYRQWQRTKAGWQNHLIVLGREGASPEHLMLLAEELRALWEDDSKQFSVVVAGNEACARLRHKALDASVFSGIRVEHVPDLTPGDVASEDRGLLEACGWHPGFLDDAKRAGAQTLHQATELLAQNPNVLDILNKRLEKDNADNKAGKSHAASVLRRLLRGEPVKALHHPRYQDKLRYPEVRLYYDGMLSTTAEHVTCFRCEAVRIAAAWALEDWEEA